MASLDELTVVEVSTGLAAAYCGKLLADAGAHVVLLESSAGHPLRRRRPAPPPALPGLLFDFLNESKEVTIGDPNSDHGSSLIARADLLIEDDGLALAGAGWPGTPDPPSGPMVVAISPFGSQGPWAHRPASELTVQAAAGSLGKRGLPGREPVQAGGAISEWVTGAYAAAAAASYWWGRDRKTSGLSLDVSALECAALSLHAFMSIDASFRGGVPGPPRRAVSVPSIEPSANGYVGFSTITAQQFRDFLLMIERPDLADDPELVQVENRQSRRDEILTAIHAWTTRRSTDEIVDLATAFRIPVAPIGNGENLPSFDHMIERHVFDKGASGALRPRIPYQISPGPSRPDTSTSEAGTAEPRVPESTASGTRASDNLPLTGLKVADFTAFWAGPAATHMLAGLGADVVKIESVQRPDGMRYTSAAPAEERWWEWGAVFHGVNANKRSVTLDLADPRGHALAERLIEWADVVVENFSPRVMAHFGLGWEEVSAINPRVVMVRMPAFGLSGPWQDRTGFAMTVEQASGLAWQTGYEDGPPMDVGGVCDPMGGMHAVVALMAALGHRETSGAGSLVEVPLVEVALNAAAEHVLQFSAAGVVLGRNGNRDVAAAPQGLYECSEEEDWLALTVTDDYQWEQLKKIADLPAWIDDPGLNNVAGRAAAQDEIDAELRRWTKAATATELAEQLAKGGVPAAKVVASAAITGNPQLGARSFFEPMDHPVVGRYELPSLPFRVTDRQGPWNRTAPPTLGQHNQEVLSTLLGLDEATLAVLEADRVIGEAPL